MPEIFNRQRKIKLDAKSFAEFAADALIHIEETTGREPAIAFVSDRAMRGLNLEFRGVDKTTDVLSFPFVPDEFDPRDDFLGEVVISAEQAARQAADNDLVLETEIKQLILHGILHLCGYDHETDDGEMNARELILRDELGI